MVAPRPESIAVGTGVIATAANHREILCVGPVPAVGTVGLVPPFSCRSKLSDYKRHCDGTHVPRRTPPRRLLRWSSTGSCNAIPGMRLAIGQPFLQGDQRVTRAWAASHKRSARAALRHSSGNCRRISPLRLARQTSVCSKWQFSLVSASTDNLKTRPSSSARH
jgi:hypothetical protein